MKKVFRCLIIIGLIVIACGCTKNYKRNDIINYVKNNIGIKNFSVSKKYVIKEDSDGYKDKYWAVYDEDNGVVFYVKDDFYYSAETTQNNLEDDYYDNYYIKYESKINVNRNLSYEKIVSDGMDKNVTLNCFYKNKKELDKCFDSMKYVYRYFNGKSGLYYRIKYNFDGRKEDAPVSYYADYSGNTYKITNEDTDYYKYYHYGLMFDVDSIISEMTKTEYKEVLNNSDNFKAVKIDSNNNTIKEYDSILCPNSYSISYNALYKILKEEGYNVVGDSHNYKVYYNNSVYEFSDDFVEYINRDNGLDENYNTYYYKKDGVTYYAYHLHDWERILGNDDVKKMFDLQLNCEWQKKRINEN